MTKGVVLFSGGLDSLLAAKILMEQGISVTGFHCLLPFFAPEADPAATLTAEYARQIGIPLEFYRCDREYLDMVKNPPHGYGKNMNPCVDCKLFFIRKAIEFMRETGADFIATGEVVGQRPKSQMKNMLRHIEKESGVEGRILRPLSARLLKPTIPELEGMVDRERLYGIAGRGRGPQMELVRKYDIREYASPAGGCLFTDGNIARRVRDLLKYHDDYTPLDFYLLSVGRHFRLHERGKLIIGRNEDENAAMERHGDTHPYFIVPDFKGPVALVRGSIDERDWDLVATLITRYGKPDETATMAVYGNGVLMKRIAATVPPAPDTIDRIRL